MMKNRSDSRSDFYQTPNLEKLAKEGMVFSNAYSPAPVSVPTRCSIQFGKTPARLKSTCHVRSASDCHGEVSIAQVIKSVYPDYATAHFGKWGLSKTNTPLEQLGYDKSDGRTNNYHGDWRSLKDKRPLPVNDPKRIFSLSQRACAFMEEQVKAERPFYLQISHYAVHVQHRALKKTIEKYRHLPPGKKCTPEDYKLPPPPLNSWILEYAAMIEDMDSGIGVVLNKIDELGIANETYVIFTSDNGGDFRGNDPLRGGKGSLWEGGIRVPMIVRGLGIQPGVYCNIPVAGWDFLPTFVDLAGGGEDALPKNLDGGSLRPLFENAGQGQVIRPTEGLIFHYPFHTKPQSAIRLADYKLVKDLETEELFLFNLTDDIEEQKNLAHKMPEITNELHHSLAEYLNAVGAEDARAIFNDRLQELLQQQRRMQSEIRTLFDGEDPDARDKWATLHMKLNFINSQIEHLQRRFQQEK